MGRLLVSRARPADAGRRRERARRPGRPPCRRRRSRAGRAPPPRRAASGGTGRRRRGPRPSSRRRRPGAGAPAGTTRTSRAPRESRNARASASSSSAGSSAQIRAKPVPTTSSKSPVRPSTSTCPCGIGSPAPGPAVPSGRCSTPLTRASSRDRVRARVVRRRSSASMTESRPAAAVRSVSQITVPESIDIRMACCTCAQRSCWYVSSSASSARPRCTRSSFQARLSASRNPELIPCPMNGGITCAASPARMIRPERHRSAEHAWVV